MKKQMKQMKLRGNKMSQQAKIQDWGISEILNIRKAIRILDMRIASRGLDLWVKEEKSNKSK
jgi:hypothetical protein